MPPLLADFIYNRVCKLKCEKFLTRPEPHRQVAQCEKESIQRGSRHMTGSALYTGEN